ncbi:hypothetical protein D3C80_1526680 [compost metagenome]
MRTGIKEMHLRARQIPEPINIVLLLVDHRSLAQRPYGNRQMLWPRLSDSFEQVLVTAVQMLPEQA